jgi:hypothetical protein
MSPDHLILSPDKEWCILASYTEWDCYCVRPLSPAVRIPTNNLSWMKKKNRRWYTVANFIETFGPGSNEVLRKYSEIYTIERLLEMNDRVKS